MPGFTTVANNLPGQMQYLDLVRDCISIYSLEPLPPNDVQTAHRMGTNSQVGSSGMFAAEDNKNHYVDVTASKLDPTA